MKDDDLNHRNNEALASVQQETLHKVWDDFLYHLNVAKIMNITDIEHVWG
jgi:hypothetical protein